MAMHGRMNMWNGGAHADGAHLTGGAHQHGTAEVIGIVGIP
jgi:hypothetical protein